MLVDRLLLLLAVSLAGSLCEGANSSDIATLLQVLFSNYNVLIRPAYNQSKPTVTNVVFTMKQLESLDIKTQTMRSLGYFSINWTDEFLTWKPEDYGGIKYITVPEHMIWKPDYVINNDVNGKKRMGDGSSLVVVEYNGHILWEPGYVSTTTCGVNIKYFPFDEQTCSILLTAWMTSNTSLLTKALHKVYLRELQENGEYMVSGADTELTTYPMTYINFENLEGIAFTVTLKRRTTFYWLSLVSPLVVFPYLSPLSFLVPADSGEKTTLAITALLSIFVFMGTIYDSLPKLSNSISYFVLLASVQIFTSLLTVIFNVIILSIQRLSTVHKIPKVLEKRIKPKYFHMNSNQPSENSSYGKPSHDTVTWTMVAAYIDKVCFYVSFASVTIVTLVFMTLTFY